MIAPPPWKLPGAIAFRAAGRPHGSLAHDSFDLFRLNCFWQVLAQELCHRRHKLLSPPREEAHARVLGVRAERRFPKRARNPLGQPSQPAPWSQLPASRPNRGALGTLVVSSLDWLSHCCPFPAFHGLSGFMFSNAKLLNYRPAHRIMENFLNPAARE
jgi:hypothetical protein